MLTTPSSTRLLSLLALAATTHLAMSQSQPQVPDYATSEAGNPFVEGWYADPDAAYHNSSYWVYPTTSLPYVQQTHLDAFSSPDLVTWTKHPDILTTVDVSWAHKAMWAPATAARDDRYFLYFAANDIQSDDEVGGIGVAVADAPGGPYRDALGAPLIGAFHNGAQPIDQSVFVDDDGQAYIYYGGWGHCNVAKLNGDMTSVGTFDDGETFKEITPKGYVEGALMVKREGRYYFFWSEGGWTGPDYAVSYAISDSPLGPFSPVARILQQDPAVATGSGHNGIIRVPDTDIHYIVYHRHPLGDTDGNHRQLAYDRLHFAADGTISPVKMLVRDNFADGNTIGWRALDGAWAAQDGHLAGGPGGASTVLNVNFINLRLDVNVTLTTVDAEAGAVFRVTGAQQQSIGKGSVQGGYYAAIGASGYVVVGRSVSEPASAGGWVERERVCEPGICVGERHHLRVQAVGVRIQVFVDDMSTPKLVLNDTEVAGGSGPPQNGTVGLRVHAGSALFDDFAVDKQTPG